MKLSLFETATCLVLAGLLPGCQSTGPPPTTPSVTPAVVTQPAVEPGSETTRSGFVKALESSEDLDLGLGPALRLDYGPNDHKNFDQIYSSVVQRGKPVILAAGWPEVKKSLHVK